MVLFNEVKWEVGTVFCTALVRHGNKILTKLDGTHDTENGTHEMSCCTWYGTVPRLHGTRSAGTGEREFTRNQSQSYNRGTFAEIDSEDASMTVR